MLKPGTGKQTAKSIKGFRLLCNQIYSWFWWAVCLSHHGFPKCSTLLAAQFFWWTQQQFPWVFWVWPLALGLAAGPGTSGSAGSALLLQLLMQRILLLQMQTQHRVHATHHACEMRKDERRQKKTFQGEYCLITKFLWYSREYHRKTGKSVTRSFRCTIFARWHKVAPRSYKLLYQPHQVYFKLMTQP